MKRLILVLGLLLSTISVHATLTSTTDDDTTGIPITAKNARSLIMFSIYTEHRDAIDWWVDHINAKITDESIGENATVSIDVTKASTEVQTYLGMLYGDVGYHSELLYHDSDHEKKVYLGLSW